MDSSRSIGDQILSSGTATALQAGTPDSEREGRMAMFNRILCPIDFDGNSADALRMARQIAEEHNALLYVLHVVSPGDPTVVSAPLISQRVERDARAELEKIEKRELTGVQHEIMLRFGHPAKEIVAAEVETKAELVVMATHGRTGVSHLLLGSIAEKVVRESSCPVLTVRMRPIHESVGKQMNHPTT
jgi:universal stress protein A